MADRKLNLPRFLPYQLSIASNAVSALIATEYEARFGLRIPEWRLLAVIGDRGSMTQSQLVNATRMDKVGVSRATTKLVERGLLARVPHAGDGRSHHLALTPTGREMYQEIVPAALELERKMMKNLTLRERDQLWNLLERLRGKADELREQSD